jgi:hypothetical protein
MEKIKNKNNLDEKEMYFLIENKEEDIKNFLDNIKYLEENLHKLEENQITDANNKMEMIKPLEEKSIGLDSNLMRINMNVDTLLKNYSETCDVVNRKFAMYDKLLKKLENK